MIDKSWMREERWSKPYKDGIKAFIRFALTNLKLQNKIVPLVAEEHICIPCPCRDCANRLPKTVSVVEVHLTERGFDKSYEVWTKHGEEYAYHDQSQDSTPTFVDDLDNTHDNTSFEIPETPPTDPNLAKLSFTEAMGDEILESPDKWKLLIDDLEQELYPGCAKFTKLSAMMELFNLKTKYGAADKFYNELLPLIIRMLPDDCKMVKSTYEGKKVMKAMGSGYNKIHSCLNNCIVYTKKFKDLTSCPKCGQTRWKQDEKTNKIYDGIPGKVAWYFPIIPRLQRLFQVKNIAKDLIWHETERKKEEGVLRHPADAPAWRVIDEKFPDFGGDPRNLRLGISADGVDVHSGNRHHSVWPVLAVIYNLPPWLCMKRKFIMLSLLISGTPGQDIDVYLEPLIDDLQLLFDMGVETYDAFKEEKFNLRAVVLWTINDYPALGTLCGCPYGGYRGCVVCREDTQCTRLGASNKQSYLNHRRYLPYGHVFRKQAEEFNGEIEDKTPLEVMTGEQIYNEVKSITNSWGKARKTGKTLQECPESSTPGRGGKIGNKLKGTEKPYWKKFNIWFRCLRYWRYNSVQHCLDFMHIEKNVAESIMGTLLNIQGKTKDGLQARQDLKLLNIRSQYQPDADEGLPLPPASYTLSNKDKETLCQTLHDIRVPEGYCSSFAPLVHVKDRKLIGFKSHDYHMLMQQFLPIAIRTLMPEATRNALIRFCFFFKAISSKEIKVAELDKMQSELCITLCLLEKYFPPAFFDIMIHLTVHLTREVKLCGPVCFRWMYPFERCMKVIKGHVRNRNRPEGCIAEETVLEETLEFVGEFYKSMNTVGIPPDLFEEEESDYMSGKPLSACKWLDLSGDVFRKAHHFVLQNINDTDPFMEEHMMFLRSKDSRKSLALLEEEHTMTFGGWLKAETLKKDRVDDFSETLKWIANGPHPSIASYDTYRINGYLFRTKEREGKVNQNSGVMVRSKEVVIKQNSKVSYIERLFYGVLKDIWVLDYHAHKIALFKCDWVDNKTGVKIDKLGYTTVKLGKLGGKQDPWVMASQAAQVFYVQDQADKSKSIVFMTPSKSYRDANDKEEFSTVIYPENTNKLPHVDPKDGCVKRVGKAGRGKGINH